MRAIVMAAGLGTRLRPLTDTLPKPLVPVGGRPMIEYVLELLERHRFTEALVNIHYLPEQMRKFVDGWNRAGRVPRLTIQDETDAILGSGGGVARAAPWLFARDDCALVCNADVLAAPDLSALTATHRRLAAQGIECTLTVTPHPEAGRKYNGLRVVGDLVAGFEQPGQPDPKLFHFPGFYILSAAATARFPADKGEFSVVEALWKPLLAKKKLGAFRYYGHYLDLGTVRDIKAAEEFLDA